MTATLTAGLGVDRQEGGVGLQNYWEAKPDVEVDCFTSPIDAIRHCRPHLPAHVGVAMVSLFTVASS